MTGGRLIRSCGRWRSGGSTSTCPSRAIPPTRDSTRSSRACWRAGPVSRGIGFAPSRSSATAAVGASHELRDLFTRNGLAPPGALPTETAGGAELLRDAGRPTSTGPSCSCSTASPDRPVEPRHRRRPRRGRAGRGRALRRGDPGCRPGRSRCGGLRRLRRFADPRSIEREAIGGQAGTSSSIRNFLGFPAGISGNELAPSGPTSRPGRSASRSGSCTRSTELRPGGDVHTVVADDGSEIEARSVIVATGVTYRRFGVPSVEARVGAGVFYGAAAVSESPKVRGQHVFVVGGANSAGQAAIHLAKYAEHVTMLVRGPIWRPPCPTTSSPRSAGTEHLGPHRHRGRRRARRRPARAPVACATGWRLDRAGDRGRPLRPHRGSPHTDWLPPEIEVDPDGLRRDGPTISPTGPSALESRDPCCSRRAFPASTRPATSAVGR